jgi:hypothetical protein
MTEVNVNVKLELSTVAMGDETVERFLSRHISKMEMSAKSLREWCADNQEVRTMTVSEAVKAGWVVIS